MIQFVLISVAIYGTKYLRTGNAMPGPIKGHYSSSVTGIFLIVFHAHVPHLEWIERQRQRARAILTLSKIIALELNPDAFTCLILLNSWKIINIIYTRRLHGSYWSTLRRQASVIDYYYYSSALSSSLGEDI